VKRTLKRGLKVPEIVKGEASTIIEIALIPVGYSHVVHYQASGSLLIGSCVSCGS
jgi:hypothetical protein